MPCMCTTSIRQRRSARSIAPSMRGVGAAALEIGDRPGRPGRGDQRAGGAGARAGDHDGSVAGAHQGGIELSQHLLGAADGVMAHRGEREGDAQNAKFHAQARGARARRPAHATRAGATWGSAAEPAP